MVTQIKQDIIYELRTNPVVRFFAWPMETMRRKCLQHSFLKSEDSAFLKTLRNKHQGQRCFIVGNGPSLLPSDLDRLTNEMTFAANRIYHIYSKTAWRPTYYVSIDNDNLMAEMERIKKSGTYLKFINYKAKKYKRTKQDNICYLFYSGKFGIFKRNGYIGALSEDVSHHSNQFATVTATAIELAIFMGFTKIYLLGVDNSFVKTIGKNGKIYVDKSMKSSYFKGMRDADGNLADGGICCADVYAINVSYMRCKTYAETHGIKIYNATRGGKLEVFDRVDFDSLFNQ